MKINYKNTALDLLDRIDASSFRVIDDGGQTTFEEKMRLAHSIINKWPALSERFKKKKQYISDPFYEAYDKGCYKLKDVLDTEEIDESGTFIFRVTPSETNTIFYSIQTCGKDKEFDMDATILFFSKEHKKDKPSLGLVAQRRYGFPAGVARFYASKKAEDAGLTSTSVIVDIFTMILFMKYCELETKIIKANKKDVHINTKYVNETDHDVEILDSTWFTTIVKSEGFGVRGHFRFQPYGPNMLQRRLQWIAAYEKEGYTKKAKILSQ